MTAPGGAVPGPSPEDGEDSLEDSRRLSSQSAASRGSAGSARLSAIVTLPRGATPPTTMNYGAQRALTVADATAFVPRRVVQLYASEAAPAPPCSAPLRALLLFADVSGYSRLTRWMAGHFEDGPWATSQILNKLFGGMAACVQAHGGDILKFAGDAILVCWPLTLEPNAEQDAAAAAAALACCQAMLRLDATAPAPGEPPLTLHIALHCGTLAEMHLGDGDVAGGRWEHMVAGHAVAELGSLIAAAESGDVAASDAFWSLLASSTKGDSSQPAAGEACAGGRLVNRDWLAAPVGLMRAASSGAPEPPVSADVLAAVERYLPRSLVDTLAAGNQFWLAENRRVAVMFVSLPPCGADDFALAQALVAEVHAVVGRSGGSCQQTITDDKGTVTIGVWGKPPLSHADDACRALAAAQTLSSSLRRIATAAMRTEPIAVGVTYGRAFCGNVGSPLRCEWCVVGDVMNTASRLMAAAAASGKPICCDSAVARAAADAALDEGAPQPAWFRDGATLMQLKGHTGPFSVYSPTVSEPVSVTAQQRLSAGKAAATRPPRRSVASPCGLDSPRINPLVDGATAAAAAAAPSGAAEPQQPSPTARMSVSTLSELATPTEVDEGELSDIDRSSLSSNMDRPAQMFGRDADLARVLALLADASSRRGLLLVISGGLSMGKTSFLRGCSGAARDAGMRVFALAPPGGGVSAETPYHSWRMAWMVSTVTEELDALPAHLRPLAPLLADVLPPGAHVAEQLATAESEAALASLADVQRPAALAELVSAVLRRTLDGGDALLLQDDVSEADALSCELLAAVLSALRPAVLVTAGRGELEDPDSDATAVVAHLSSRATAVRTCSLGPLAAAAVEALCAAELGVLPPGLPPGLARSLMALTGGHPLFVKELLSLLVRQGHLALEDGSVVARCDVTKLDELAALGPADSDGMARLEVLVQRRVDSLGPAARSALKAAAVLARDFDLPSLARAYAGHVTLAAARLLAAELVDEGMWVHTSRGDASAGGGGGAKYRFAHEVVRALVYASTPSDQRAELHARVLRSLEESQELGNEDGARGGGGGAAGAGSGAHTATSALHWAERARHARGAGLHTKAVSYFLASARASATGVAAARRVADAARFAQEGLASLRAAAEQDAGAARQEPPGGEPPLTPSSSGHARASQSPLDTLRAELLAVLDAVQRVQASWARVEPKMDTHGVALMRDFFARCPDALPMFSFGHMSLDDIEAQPKMRKHAITLMSTVGSCVAGLRDFEAMIPTLVNVGKMHYKFGANIRTYFPPMGASLIVTLRAALGADFTPDVEAAWQAMYDVISLHIFDGIDKAARAAAEESSLRGQLLGM